METIQVNVALRDKLGANYAPRIMKYIATLHLGGNTSITAYGITPATAVKNAVLNSPNLINYHLAQGDETWRRDV